MITTAEISLSLLGDKPIYRMQTLENRIEQLFSSQMEVWDLARENYADLSLVETHEFDFGDFNIIVQFNPKRMVSTTAKIDAVSLAARKCFLCRENRPQQQERIEWRDYDLLVNPFPIFRKHFVFAKQAHEPQQIVGTIGDMLELARELPNYAVFYNGPKAGASAPDHHHFQAAEKELMPLIGDYERLSSSFKAFGIDNYLRTVHIITADDQEQAVNEFHQYLKNHPSSDGDKS